MSKMNPTRARKLVLLFIACLALGVFAAPIPAPKSTSHLVIDPPEPLRGPDGKLVDMSKWPWKRSDEEPELVKRFYMLPEPIAKLLAVHPATSLPASGLAGRSEEVHGHDLRELNLVGASGNGAQTHFGLAPSAKEEKPSEAAAEADTDVKPKPKKTKTKTKPAASVKPHTPKVQVPVALQADKPAPIVHPYQNHRVRHRPRSLEFDEDDLEEREEDEDDVRRYYPLVNVLRHNREIGMITRDDMDGEEDILERTPEDEEEEATLFKRFYPLRGVLERDIRLGYIRRRAPQASSSALTTRDLDSNSDAWQVEPVFYEDWHAKRSMLLSHLDSLESRFFSLEKSAEEESRRAVEEDDLERRWMGVGDWEELERRLIDFKKLMEHQLGKFSGNIKPRPISSDSDDKVAERGLLDEDEDEELERRLTDFAALWAKLEKQNGGKKHQRKSSRPHDANSATTPGALFMQPGAKSGLPPTAEVAPTPIERRELLDEAGIDTRGWDEEDMDELERRLTDFKALWAKIEKMNGGKKPQRKSSRKHDANSATTPGALFMQPGAKSGLPAGAEVAPTPIERRQMIDEVEIDTRGWDEEDREELERRLTDFAALWAKLEKKNGGKKHQRKSSRPHDADSATTPGALFLQPGAKSGLPAAETAPTPIERRELLDEIDTRALDLDEYAEEIARRLVLYRRILTSTGGEDGSQLPVQHAAHASFLFNNALRETIHPHGLHLLNGGANAVDKQSFKAQLANARAHRAKNSKKANKAKKARERALKLKAAKAAKSDEAEEAVVTREVWERDVIDEEAVVRREWDEEDE